MLDRVYWTVWWKWPWWVGTFTPHKMTVYHHQPILHYTDLLLPLKIGPKYLLASGRPAAWRARLASWDDWRAFDRSAQNSLAKTTILERLTTYIWLQSETLLNPTTNWNHSSNGNYLHLQCWGEQLWHLMNETATFLVRIMTFII